MTEQSSPKQSGRDDLEGKLQAVYESLTDDAQAAETLRLQDEVQGYGSLGGEVATPMNAVRWAYSRFGGLS